MSQPLPASAFFLIAGLGFILLVLLAIIIGTTRIGIRRGKVEPPKFWSLVVIAFLQILLGCLAIFAARAIHNDPWIDIGTGLGVTILSGLFFIKWMLRTNWKRSLRVRAVAALLQVVLVPLCAGILAVGWLMLYYLLYPPQL